MQCTATTKSKNRCKANAIDGYSTCYRHTPELKQDALMASKNGGYARKHYQEYFKQGNITSPSDIKLLLEKTLQSILSGKMPASSPGNTIGFLARCWLDAYDKSDIEGRIQKIEQALFPNESLD